MSPRRQIRFGEEMGMMPFVAASPMRSAVWYHPMSSNTGAIKAEAELNVSPLFIGKDCTLDRLAINITVVGTAGSLIRAGVYADDGTGFPGALVVDGGTVAGDGTTGFKTYTISTPIKRGLYWVGAVNQGAAGTRATLSSCNGNFGFVGDPAATSAGTNFAGLSMNSVTGALPAAFTVAALQGSSPMVWIRAV